MALQGSFQDFGLPDIFQLISLQRKTGILTVRSEHEVIRIVFYQGHIIEADSEPRRFEDRLGQVLVRTGRITQEQLDQALEQQRKTLKRLGLVLLELGFIDEPSLKQALEMQISQTVYRTFRWKAGEYSFETKDDIQFDSRIDVMLSTDNVLMEGIQIVDEWPVIQRRIPDFNIVFRQTVSPEAIVVEDSTDELDLSFGLVEEKQTTTTDAADSITMNRDEFQVFQAVDGRRTVQEIMDSLPLPEFTVLKSLYEFYNRGLIAPVDRPHRITEVVEPTEVEVKPVRIPGAQVFAFLGTTFFFLVVLKSLTAPFAPYAPPREGPTYRHYVTTCESVLKPILIGFYLQQNTWPASSDAATLDPIFRVCTQDPLGRPVTLQREGIGIRIQFLDARGKVMVDDVVPEPFINRQVLLDPMQGLSIRAPDASQRD